jgi:hypothetical protein
VPAAPKPDEPAPNPDAATPAPAVKPPDPATQPPKPPVKKTDKGSKPPKPAASLDDATKYRNAKAAALEDPAIKELKAKADGAVIEAEAHAASVAFNRALFGKVREIDPSLDKYVDGVEAAMMKRLNAEKKGE